MIINLHAHPICKQLPLKYLQLKAKLYTNNQGIYIQFTLGSYEFFNFSKPLSFPKAPLIFTDKLWEESCFEVFVAPQDQSDYQEFNFSTANRWFSRRFVDYRQANSSYSPPSPKIRFKQTNKTLHGSIFLNFLNLPTTTCGRYLLALSAVLKDEQGNLSYWAVKHTQDQPDFHHPASFVILLNKNQWQIIT